MTQLVLSLRNRTEPSHIRTLAPPEWKLQTVHARASGAAARLAVLQFGYLRVRGEQDVAHRTAHQAEGPVLAQVGRVLRGRAPSRWPARMVQPLQKAAR